MRTLLSVQHQSKWIFLIVALFGFMTIPDVAEAKRFGGGKSFGFQKKVAPKNYNTPSPQKAPDKASTNPANNPAQPASGAARMMGPLAGLAAGGLLAALLFGDAFQGIQIMDILLFGLVAFLLFRLFASKARSQQTAYESGYGGTPPRQDYEPVIAASRNQHQPQPEEPQSIVPPIGGGQAATTDSVTGFEAEFQTSDPAPAWFNGEQFLDGAKHHFENLQRAWDAVDLAEMESYCTPELYSALQQELSSMKPGDNQTDIDTLDAEIADSAVDGEYFVVSVRFTGFIKENSGEAHAFHEIWHIKRLVSNEGNWLIAGIQQSDAPA